METEKNYRISMAFLYCTEGSYLMETNVLLGLTASESHIAIHTNGEIVSVKKLCIYGKIIGKDKWKCQFHSI